jgi:hypothetical protein
MSYVNGFLFGDNGRVRNPMQALGEKYGLLPGYEEEVKKTTREPKNKGVGKKTLPLQPEQTEVRATLLSPCSRHTDNCVAMPIRIRISILTPIQIWIRNGIKTMPIHMWILPLV